MSTLPPAAADRSGEAPLSAAASSRKESASLSLTVLGCRPWTARHIRNPNLRAHLRQMGRASRSGLVFQPKEAYITLIRLCRLLESRSRILTELHPNALPAVPALFRMAVYRDRFVREIESWHPDPEACARDQWRSLVTHLFEKWPVPPAFAEAWFTVGPVRHIERDWYCHLATGGSLRRLPGMPPLTASAAHAVHSAPPGLSACGAIRWAQLRALKCPDNLAEAVLRTSVAADFANDGIWLPLIEKFIAARQIDPGEFGVVTDGFRLLINESGTRRARELLRQPLRDLVRHWRKRWWQFLEYALPPDAERDRLDLLCSRLRSRIVNSLHTTWSSMPGVTSYTSPPGFHCGKRQQWTIAELCSQRVLLEEGRFMRHCVVLYGRTCRKGWWAIFRMRLRVPGKDGDDEETEHARSNSWTIRVDCDLRRVVEIKGYRNRLPDATAMQVIRSWAAQNGLRIARQLK